MMAVYVSNLMPCVKNTNWHWNENCYLVADDIDELHTFARRLGLKRTWFQKHQWLPHYDLTRNKRVQAIRMGAINIDRNKLVSMMRQKRDA